PPGARCLFAIPPPDGRKGRELAILWQSIGTTEAVPARGSPFAIGPLRHNIEIPHEHTIKRARRRHKLVAAFCKYHAFDQSIDGGILDPSEVSRAHLIGRRRTPAVALFIAGREGFPPTSNDDVVVPIAQTVLVLGLIDRAHRYRDTKTFQGLLVEQDNPF